jgi:nitrite reductase/ring-hydroxylating ferredoxin subunit
MPGLPTTPEPSPQPLCRSDALEDRGLAQVFDVQLWRQPARAFALRFDGRVVAYINRCAHVPVEMDWQPGRFLDIERRWIICSIHGATYDPVDGRCVGGPCAAGRLKPVEIDERDGWVYWYPSRDVTPVSPDDTSLTESSP